MEAMKKEKVVHRYYPYKGKVLTAKREIPFAMKLTAKMLLDEICFNWNKGQIEEEINDTLAKGDKEEFKRLCEVYMDYIWE